MPWSRRASIKPKFQLIKTQFTTITPPIIPSGNNKAGYSRALRPWVIINQGSSSKHWRMTVRSVTQVTAKSKRRSLSISFCSFLRLNNIRRIETSTSGSSSNLILISILYLRRIQVLWTITQWKVHQKSCKTQTVSVNTTRLVPLSLNLDKQQRCGQRKNQKTGKMKQTWTNCKNLRNSWGLEVKSSRKTKVWPFLKTTNRGNKRRIRHQATT